MNLNPSNSRGLKLGLYNAEKFDRILLFFIRAVLCFDMTSNNDIHLNRFRLRI
jgi:hypothetical protein